MPRPIHFDLHVTDLEKAIDFYTKIFGWKFEKYGPEEMGYYLVSTGEKETPGIDGGITRSRDGQARTVNTIQVDSVDDYLKKIVENGGQVALPKMPIPGVGYVAYVIAPGGLLFGIMHDDPSAK